MASTNFVIQTQNKTASFAALLKSLLSEPGLEEVRIAVAYARWDGIGLISTELEKLLECGGKFEAIYGAGNGVTTPDALLYGLYLKELYPTLVTPLLVKDEFANSIFHPKLYQFKFLNHYIVVVGSANLTGGGLVRNSELAVQIRVPAGGSLEKNLDAAWNKLRQLAVPVTAKLVRKLMQEAGAGSEADKREGFPKIDGRPYMKTGPKVAPKPLFQKVLGLKSATKKSKILSKLDTLSQKPSRLYLQIFATETGGAGGNPGYQVQLPVATLAAYFGVGETQTKMAEFRFKSEMIKTNLTHFDNHTHRVRLKPILQIARPAILIFERVADDIYTVGPERPARYVNTLATKCTQQSRAGSRRWGFE